MLRSKTRSVDVTQKNNYSPIFSKTLSASKLCRGDVIRTQIDAKALKSVDNKKQSKASKSSQAKMRTNEAFLHPNKANELKTKLESTKSSLEASRHELKSTKSNMMVDSLESELVKSRHLESEKAAPWDKMNKELSGSKEGEKRTAMLLHENEKRIQELEDELESSKTETVTLRKTIESLEEKLSAQNTSHKEKQEENEIGLLKLELQSALKEMQVLKNERRLAIEAEEKSAKAMEDLALALKEVASESNQAKEKLETTQAELNHARLENEQVRKTLNETKQESELHKNTANRLKIEAEETLLAVSEKEMGFVSYIKRAEDERAAAQRENVKLRDILKQAVNEANAAKAAAGIARQENSLLQHYVIEKDERLHFLARENERLRTRDAVARENAKQFC
ncbi:Myosin heavy chain-related protein [Striga hermonthica]|uniref:Myosin heavy chain-related protein n=1 Tax=Striga hermonthica TaxID=68872 RepID=A0A9N7N0B7_STRHE|nr:Myosin heavy chain-related protein [Striga hermonthica]